MRRFQTFGLFNAHTGKQIGETYPSRAAAEVALFAAGDHALRVRGVTPINKRPSMWDRFRGTA